MASEQRKKAAKKAEKANLNDTIAATDNQSETDQFKCGKCKKRKCKFYQMQTRSADEVQVSYYIYICISIFDFYLFFGIVSDYGIEEAIYSLSVFLISRLFKKKIHQSP